VEYIIRQKIYDSMYWKAECFGLSAERLVDKAVELRAIGGMYGEPQKPTDFICLILKMLQIQPEKAIIVEFIKNDDFKYLRLLGGLVSPRPSREQPGEGRVRVPIPHWHVTYAAQWPSPLTAALLLPAHPLSLHSSTSPPPPPPPRPAPSPPLPSAGAFYLRLVGRAVDIFQYLEPLYNDFRRVRVRGASGGFELTHMDSLVDQMLHGDYLFNIALPRLPSRITMEKLGQLEPRMSVLDEEFDEAALEVGGGGVCGGGGGGVSVCRGGTGRVR
jgi:hypothetical protein